MPSWQEVFQEVQRSNPDAVRRKYLKKLSDYTKRNVIAYYSGYMSKPGIQLLEITDEDMNGFMMAVHSMDRSLGLDLILHTPGGSISSTEAIVNYLHSLFGSNIRAIVPQAAMSAGTMVACSCSEILLGKQSSLGPIDPQLRGIPAQGVLDEFAKALEDYKLDNDSIVVWKEVLSKYHPTFIGQCRNAVEWTKRFVTEQLATNMFSGDADAQQKAEAAVERLSDASQMGSHDRHIPASKCATEIGLKIRMIEDDQTLQDLILTVHHCYMHALSNSGAFKIIENQAGSAFVKQQQQQVIPFMSPMGPIQVAPAQQFRPGPPIPPQRP